MGLNSVNEKIFSDDCFATLQPRNADCLQDTVLAPIIQPMRLDFFPLPFLAGLGILLVLILILRLTKRSWSYLFFFSTFWIYLLFMIGLIVFPIPLSAPLEISKIGLSFQSALERIHLIPHNYSNFDFYPGYFKFEIIGNILLTIPFGFGVIWVYPSVSNKILPVALAVGLLNETAQFLLLVLWGFGFRVVDINDVFLNASGVFIGYLLYKIFSWTLRRIVKLFRIQPKGLLKYVYETDSGNLKVS